MKNNQINNVAELVSSTICLAQEKFKDPDTNKLPEFILTFPQEIRVL